MKNKRRKAWLLVIVVAAIAAPSLARLVEQSPGDTRPATAREPQEVVRVFLTAVDRGELRVFGRKLDRTMIVPVRVEYAYAVDSRVSVIRVYSNLRQPILTPDHKDCEVRGVSAVLNDEGGIIEIEAHVWPK